VRDLFVHASTRLQSSIFIFESKKHLLFSVSKYYRGITPAINIFILSHNLHVMYYYIINTVWVMSSDKVMNEENKTSIKSSRMSFNRFYSELAVEHIRNNRLVSIIIGRVFQTR